MPRRVRISGRIGRMASAKMYKVSGTAPESFGNLKMAPKFSMQLHGLVSVNRVFRKIYKNAESDTKKAIERASRMIVIDVKKNLIQGANKAYDTGELYRSIRYQVVTMSLNIIYSTVGSYDVPYAIYVHEGARGKAPNEFLRRSLDKNKDKIIGMISAGIRRDIEKGII